MKDDREFVALTGYLRIYPVASELESILLESQLIGLHQPKFNAIAKDDRSALVIGISRDEFPRVSLVRGRQVERSIDVYGPFLRLSDAQLVLKAARKVFGFCAQPPQKGKTKRRCFYFHLGWCSGACAGLVSAKDYRRKIGYLKKFLKGQIRGVVKQLTGEIKRAAKKEKFEQAAALRQILQALTNALAGPQMGVYLAAATPRDRVLKELGQVLGLADKLERIEAFDVATISQRHTVGAMVVYFLGWPDKGAYRRFRIKSTRGGDPVAMAEMLARRFSHDDWPKPDLILLDGGKPQLSTVLKRIKNEIPIVALAKKEEILIVPTEQGYREIDLGQTAPRKLLQEIRDEVHRFATLYHKQVRGRSMLK